MLHDEAALDLVRGAFLVTLKISGPILAAGVVVGLVISVVQAVTSIQDQALSFVPKIAAMLLVSMALLGWIVERLVAFTASMFTLTI